MNRERTIFGRAASFACALAALAYGVGAFAQPAAPVETVVKQADAAYAEAMNAASQAYVRTRKAELAEWVAAQEKALASAISVSDQEGIDYLTEIIGRSKRAGYIVEPMPKDAVKFRRNDYALIADPLPWHVAKRQCERMGGHLVTIETEEEEAFVLEKFGQSLFWVGAGDAAEEGTFVWLSGRPYQTFGVKARLDNGRKNEHAVHWNPQRPGIWDDGNESVSLPFVCEWER
ncbi:MAG TPA: C-type lectin domain-containing protein [Pirellulaceae bacterium]|nr:C-type lectin domain-containing protein [Pirellulaceae bacterium]